MAEFPCGSCGTVNEADARFCEGCGSALDRRCGACGTSARATARFCRNCGGPLDSTAEEIPTGPVRKIVTVLFADLAGSTSFEEGVDAETAREVMGGYHSVLRSTAERHRAGVTKYIGDGFMAVWGVPEVSAADADHAVEAAVELQERFVDLAARVADAHGANLSLRVAVNTGEVVVGSGDADLVGDALNVAARLESECPHGQVVVGEETWRSTRGRYRYEPLEPVQVKGRLAPVAVYQLTARRTEPADSVPFVGRTHEFRRLAAVLDEAIARRSARLVTVIGDPGVGKSRLAAEFANAARDSVVIQIRCAAEGTVALAPVVDVLRARDLDADLPSDVVDRDRILRDLRGVIDGVAGSVEETFWGLRRYFEVLAGRAALILVLDDIHWADALLLDFVEHLTEWVRDAPILMIALARPELRESRPELITVGGSVGDAIRLGGLEPSAIGELAARVAGSGRLPSELLWRLPASTGGNPLFVRELIAMLVHDGVLVPETDEWRLTIDVDAIAVPPTIQALLASRLERMHAADRRVLEVASVIGTDFSPAAVSALSGVGALEVKASLDRLRRLELAQPSGAYTGDEPVWRFHHILIRDVAYRRLLKSDRAELHEQFVDWVQADGRAAVFESDELVARHLESAHGYRRELGTRDSHTSDLALRSARCYLSAAKRALERDALVSAASQAARGVALASDEPALQRELLLVGCEAYLSTGDVAAGAALVDQFERVADDALAPWAICYRCQYIAYTDPSRLPEVDDRLQPVIEEFVRRGDATGVAKAYRVRASARGRLGRIGDAESDLFEALIAARQCGDHRQITACLGAAPNAALWGPSPAPKAGGRCLDVVRMQRMTTAAPSLEATSLRCLAVLELLRGRPDKARSMLADARAIVAELGLRHGLMETELYAGYIELVVGDSVAAEPHFRTALEGLDSLGVGADAGQAAALLARSVLAQGRIEEADRYAAESERIAGHNLKSAIAWRAVRAEILSAQGSHDRAIALGREAVAMAAGTDLVLDCADAWLALSRVLTAADDRRGAADAAREAESLYAAKEAVLLVGNTPAPVATADEQTGHPRPAEARLSTENRAAKILYAAWNGSALAYSEDFVYEDNRRVTGEPIVGGTEFLAAAQRKLEQYPHVEAPVLAARGERLTLIALHWWDDVGNQTTSLDFFELDESDSVRYHGRFDGDDFATAYQALEERYYRGEGAAFTANGLALLEFQKAVWAQDVEVARALVRPDWVWCAEPSTLKPGERSLAELFSWRSQRLDQVASFEDWLAALHWVSPVCCIALCEMRATGRDGEEFRWSRIYVARYRDGLMASGREFDVADEDAAYAYAESVVAGIRRRLVLGNRLSAAVEAGWRATGAHDVDGLAAVYSPDFSYDDHRRLSGTPFTGKAALRWAATRIFEQYPHVEWRPLAVRGESLQLFSGRWWDENGNEVTYLDLYEAGADGLIGYHGRFDEDDFVAAYAELDRRYYAGEGAEFGDAGRAAAGWVEGIARRDIDMVRRCSAPDFRWVASASSLKKAERTVEEMFDWLRERGEQVSSQRHWLPVMHWLSPTCAVGLVEITAVGQDGERYEWTSVVVSRFRDDLLASVHEFDTEEEAFAFAERLSAGSNRLRIANRASEVGQRLLAAVRAGDVDAANGCYGDEVGYDDRRALSGDPLLDGNGRRAAFERLVRQFSSFEVHTLAVRGERLHLAHYRWSDHSGNETSGLVLEEIDHHDRIVYDGRFDEDDFLSAYLELERRYFAGEGAEFADAGAVMVEMAAAANQGDLDKIFNELFAPGIRIQSRSRTIIPDRSLAEFRSSVEEFNAMVSSSRLWYSAAQWVSPSCVVARQERRAYGTEGQRYEWSRIYVGESSGGRITATCEFDVEFEDQAFAFAEQLVRARESRLAATNRAADVGQRMEAAVRAGRPELAVELVSERVVYEDRRRISGYPITGRSGVHAALEALSRQFGQFERRILAVRGERLVLAGYRWSDESGNESRGLLIDEIGDDGLIACSVRFDPDDFESAYRELERRYYAGEGAVYAAAGMLTTEFVTALSRGEVDSALRLFNNPGLRFENRSRALFGERSMSELRDDLAELVSMMAHVRWWYSAVCWPSPNVCVARQEREATGADGERYAWADLYVAEFRGNVCAWSCRFDIDDEANAFAAAEDRIRLSRSRLAVSNRVIELRTDVLAAIQRGDLDTAADAYADDLVYDDRRRMWGESIENRGGMRAAWRRLLRDYNNFGGEVLAVRGDRLGLGRYNCSDDAGNRTGGLLLVELNDAGRIGYEARFDEDDFDAAYAELDKRYYAGDGAEFADYGLTIARYFATKNRGDLDTLFAELISPDLRLESRSRSVFAYRNAAEHRASIEELDGMVESVRDWASAVHHLSPMLAVARYQRRGVGSAGEDYQWERIVMAEFLDGRLCFACEFEPDDEDAAFAYAEERLRASRSKLSPVNLAAEVLILMVQALSSGDVSRALAAYRDDFCTEDRRRWGSGIGPAAWGKAIGRASLERILEQFKHFEWKTLAVRGQRSVLGLSRWLDELGNQSSQIHVVEVDGEGRIAHDSWYDEDGFDAAYHELDRRFFAGEGAAFAARARFQSAFIDAINQMDIEAARELCLPSFRLESPQTTLASEDRSIEEFFSWIAERVQQVASVRHWISANHWMSEDCVVGRIEIRAVGSEGDEFTWPRLAVAELRGGLLARIRQFEPDDEDAAFAYAEERLRASRSKLSLTNLAAEVTLEWGRAMQDGDVDAMLDFWSDDFVFADHRRLSGDPIENRTDLRNAAERIVKQYNQFEGKTLAVRGDRLVLASSRWCDQLGNETKYFHVIEVGDDGRRIYEGRYDEDDFGDACTDLDRRYYSTDGAEYAEAGMRMSAFTAAVSRGEYERACADMFCPDLRVTNRSRSAFPDRSGADMLASYRQLDGMLSWFRDWFPVVSWLGPDLLISRLDRVGAGHDGEQYAWERLLVLTLRDRRLATICEFDIDDEDGALAYAESLMG